MNLVAPVHRVYLACRTLFPGSGKDSGREHGFVFVGDKTEIAAKAELLEDPGGGGFYCIMTDSRCFNGSTTKE